jgi:hypothetical protein
MRGDVEKMGSSVFSEQGALRDFLGAVTKNGESRSMVMRHFCKKESFSNTPYKK